MDWRETTPAPEPCIIVVGKSFVLGQISAWVMTVGDHTGALLKSPFSRICSWDHSWLAAPCYLHLWVQFEAQRVHASLGLLPTQDWVARGLATGRFSPVQDTSDEHLFSGIPGGSGLAETSPEFLSVCDFSFLSSPFLGVRPASFSEDSPAPCLPQAFPSINFLQIEIHLCVHLSEDANGLVTLTPLDTRTANNLPWALVSSSVKMESENYKGFCEDWMIYIYLYLCVCVYICILMFYFYPLF